MTILTLVKATVFSFSFAVSAEAFACDCDTSGSYDGPKRGWERPCPDLDPVPPQNYCWIEPWYCPPSHYQPTSNAPVTES